MQGATQDTGYKAFFENFSESVFQIFYTFLVWVRSSAGRASGFQHDGQLYVPNSRGRHMFHE